MLQCCLWQVWWMRSVSGSCIKITLAAEVPVQFDRLLAMTGENIHLKKSMPMVITVQAGVALTATLKGRYSRQHKHDDTPGHHCPATPQSTNLTEYMRGGGDCTNVTNVLVYQTLSVYKPWDVHRYLEEVALYEKARSSAVVLIILGVKDLDL